MRRLFALFGSLYTDVVFFMSNESLEPVSWATLDASPELLGTPDTNAAHKHN